MIASVEVDSSGQPHAGDGAAIIAGQCAEAFNIGKPRSLLIAPTLDVASMVWDHAEALPPLSAPSPLTEAALFRYMDSVGWSAPREWAESHGPVCTCDDAAASSWGGPEDLHDAAVSFAEDDLHAIYTPPSR